MKTARTIILAIIMLSLFLQGFAPPPAPGQMDQVEMNKPRPKFVEFTVVNNTGKVASIIMDGTTQTGVDKVYTFTSYVGKNVYRIQTGVYLATFYGCGREASKKLQMKNSRRVVLTCGNKENDQTDRITIK